MTRSGEKRYIDADRVVKGRLVGRAGYGGVAHQMESVVVFLEETAFLSMIIVLSTIFRL